jgi:disulfide bond formation protein DsbB
MNFSKLNIVSITILGMILIFGITAINDSFDLTKSVPFSLAIFTLISQLVLIFVLFTILIREEDQRILGVRKQIAQNAQKLALIVSSTGMVGSLFMQFVVGWEPCELCWFQRIFMYPIPIILLHSIVEKRNGLKIAFPLAIIGGIIAAYHYGVQFFNLASVCQITSGTSECALKMYAPFGYITIPMMALSAFVIIGLLHKLSEKETI